jgi:glycine/sarcosine N-methyltransferase
MMYDAISNDYDRFVNWPSRLSMEIPFIEQQLHQTVGAGCRVLDAACGTGMHALGLARLGFQARGADLSSGMIDRARLNAAEAGLDVRFEAIGFGGLVQTFGRQACDAILCLGNSLPHLPDIVGVEAALTDFAACLRPGGLLLLQNRNFDAVLASRARWMEPQSYRSAEGEWLFLRFYDFDADGLLSFHMITLNRQGITDWSQQVTTTRLYPLRQEELLSALDKTGFRQVHSYGGMNPTPFDPAASGNLVIRATLGKNAL